MKRKTETVVELEGTTPQSDVVNESPAEPTEAVTDDGTAKVDEVTASIPDTDAPTLDLESLEPSGDALPTPVKREGDKPSPDKEGVWYDTQQVNDMVQRGKREIWDKIKSDFNRVFGVDSPQEAANNYHRLVAENAQLKKSLSERDNALNSYRQKEQAAAIDDAFRGIGISQNNAPTIRLALRENGNELSALLVKNEKGETAVDRDALAKMLEPVRAKHPALFVEGGKGLPSNNGGTVPTEGNSEALRDQIRSTFGAK